MSLFVLDTSGNQELLKADSITRPKYENSKKRKLLQESSESLGIGNIAAALHIGDNEEKKEEFDFFGKLILFITLITDINCLKNFFFQAFPLQV